MAEQQGSREPDSRQADLERMGHSPAAARAWLAEQDGAVPEDTDGQAVDEAPGDALQVWPENEAVLGVWLHLQTQWRHWPSGRLQGLRRDALDAAIARLMRGDPVARQDEAWQQLIEMEHEAVEACDG